MRHLFCAAAAVAVLTLALAAVDWLAAHSRRSGAVLVVTRGEAGPALRELLRGQDARLVQAWAGGQVVQLHAQQVGRVSIPAHTAWLVLRLPLESLALPACG